MGINRNQWESIGVSRNQWESMGVNGNITRNINRNINIPEPSREQASILLSTVTPLPLRPPACNTTNSSYFDIFRFRPKSSYYQITGLI